MSELPPEVRQVKDIADAAVRRKNTARDDLIADLQLIRERADRALERLEATRAEEGERGWQWPWKR